MMATPQDCIVIPARGLAVGKSRLAPVLDAPARERLNRQWLSHVVRIAVQVLSARGPERIAAVASRADRTSGPGSAACSSAGTEAGVPGVLVVSPDVGTLAFARECGALPLLEPTALGLNGALEWAVREVGLLGARRVLVLPADLPLLEASDLHALLDGSPDEVVIAPDSAQTGTNGLRFPLGRGFVPAFGPNSCEAHDASARAVGLSVRHLRRPGLARDIDTPADLTAWQTPSTRFSCAEAA